VRYETSVLILMQLMITTEKC